MNILFLTVGDQTVASSRVRVYGYLPFLAEKGISHKVLPFTSRAKCRRILNLKKDNFSQSIFELLYKICVITRLLVLAKVYTIVFVQKVILPKIIWGMLKTVNQKIIFDFDDAIYLYKDITYLLKGASDVIISNKYLKKFVSQYNELGEDKDIEIENPPEVENYDAIIFGSPVHAFSLSLAMKTYLEEIPSLQNKKIALFVTKGTRFNWTGGNQAINEIKNICQSKGGVITGTSIIVWNKQRENKIAELVQDFSKML